MGEALGAAGGGARGTVVVVVATGASVATAGTDPADNRVACGNADTNAVRVPGFADVAVVRIPPIASSATTTQTTA